MTSHLPNGYTRIKVCGLTRASDVRQACAVGADALGFVFYPKSKRCVSPEQAAELASHADVFTATVALFVEPDDALVHSVIAHLRPSYLQFHGDETAEQCARFDYPFIKAFRVGAPGLESATQLLKTCEQYHQAGAWLFDSYTSAYGGSGHGFDRSLLTEVLKQSETPVILSGGLTVQTVANLVQTLKPAAVDVSSGVETEPGVKCAQKLHAFAAAVRQA
jgi:phosphoribosylanthranilate isomerase